MITGAASEMSAAGPLPDGAWGRVTAGEKAARWGHFGRVLELSGPTELIDSIERSLFSIGVVSNRIEADLDDFLLHPALLEIVTRLEMRSGVLAIVVKETGGETLTACTLGRQIVLDTHDPTRAVSAVHQLLHSTGFFIPSEKAGL